MLKFLIALLAFTLVSGKSAFNFNRVMREVPEEERINYLRYHLGVGYKLDNQVIYSPKPKLNKEDSVALYRYVKEHYRVMDEEDLKQVRTIICFEDGTCIDFGDIGVHPKI